MPRGDRSGPPSRTSSTQSASATERAAAGGRSGNGRTSSTAHFQPSVAAKSESAGKIERTGADLHELHARVDEVGSAPDVDLPDVLPAFAKRKHTIESDQNPPASEHTRWLRAAASERAAVNAQRDARARARTHRERHDSTGSRAARRRTTRGKGQPNVRGCMTARAELRLTWG